MVRYGKWMQLVVVVVGPQDRNSIYERCQFTFDLLVSVLTLMTDNPVRAGLDQWRGQLWYRVQGKIKLGKNEVNLGLHEKLRALI